MIYLTFLHVHSVMRWIVLLFLTWSVVNALIKWTGKKTPVKTDRLVSLLAVAGIHVQLVLGIVLFFISPKVVFNEFTMSNALIRFFTVEHSLLMLISVVLITIGFVRFKRSVSASAGFKKLFIYHGISLLLILIAIPWPWRNLGAGWF
jgi:high-affinity Fe2+/Pb2+ permease